MEEKNNLFPSHMATITFTRGQTYTKKRKKLKKKVIKREKRERKRKIY